MNAAQAEAEQISADIDAGEALYLAFVGAAGSLTLDRRSDVMTAAACGVLALVDDAPVRCVH